jgi:hypothetical protein
MLSVLAGSACSAKDIILLGANASAAGHVHKPVQVTTSAQPAAMDVFSRHQMDTIAAFPKRSFPPMAILRVRKRPE